MTSKSVNLTGQEHLPPVLRKIADPSYKYSTHQHTVESCNDGLLHTYTIIVSRHPLDQNTLGKYLEESTVKHPSLRADSVPGQLVSQISSTTTSEKKRRTLSRSPMIGTTASSGSSVSTSSSLTEELPNNHYYSLPSITSESGVPPPPPPPPPPSKNWSSSRSSDSSSFVSSEASSLPKYTYSTPHLKSSRSAKFVMMVHVKFLLLHRDVFKKRAQAMFTDEFPSDCLLENVVLNFQQLCIRQLHGQKFNPRFSYCIGELKYQNSKPVKKSDMKKTLAQLAKTNSIVQFALIVNNIDE